MKEKETLLMCECGTELAQFYYDTDCVYVAIFAYKYHKPGLLHRLRHCWKIIRTGSPYEDQLIIGPEEVEKLKGFIDNVALDLQKQKRLEKGNS